MYLLDTNVVSEFRKIKSGKADVRVAAWAEGVDTADLYLSVITIQELEIGVRMLARRDQSQATTLRNWLDKQVLPAFAGRILAFDTAVALRSAPLHVPNPAPVRDGLIAATALVHGLIVVTRNVADFAVTGVATLNPWEG